MKTAFAILVLIEASFLADFGLSNEKLTNAAMAFVSERLPDRPTTLEQFQQKLSKTLTPESATRMFGPPDRRFGSGLIIFEYQLSDNTKIRMGFPGLAPILYAKHVKADGTMVNLPLK